MIPHVQILFVVVLLAGAGTASAQTAPPERPPAWDTQLGAAFVGTSGNSRTATLGADFSAHRRWPVWQIEAAATAVRTSDEEVLTAERYLGSFRADRHLTSIVSATMGERIERDELSGTSVRSISDLGLAYALRRLPRWTLDGVTALAWTHDDPVDAAADNDPSAVLSLLSRIPFSANAESTQRLTFYPNFSDARAYRSEAEIAAQAAMNAHLALKLGYLWRFSNLPVAGFVKSDNTMTASVVLKWKAATPAP